MREIRAIKFWIVIFFSIIKETIKGNTAIEKMEIISRLINILILAESNTIGYQTHAELKAKINAI